MSLEFNLMENALTRTYAALDREFSYDLYNTETEQREATQRMTAEDARRANDDLRRNRKPQRWVSTRWVNR